MSKDSWSSDYNPFNSLKILLWSAKLSALARGELPVPITSDTDPTNHCNYNCSHCNAQKYRSKGKYMLSEEQLIKMADIHGQWGIKSTCIAGGGEPCMNPNLGKYIRRLAFNEVGSGVITNGSVMTEEQMEAITDCCRYTGFSVDAGNEFHFIGIKGILDRRVFHRVIENLTKLCNMRERKKSHIDIAYKYLVFPSNVKSIFEGAKLAKECGVQHFHLRPGCTDNIQSAIKQRKVEFDNSIEDAKYQIALAQELEDDNFKVFGVQHKFGDKWERKVNFKKCRAVSIMPTFGADGNVHLCFDSREKEGWIMCKHEEIMDYWGSEKHRKMLETIDPKQCPRCTYGIYNEIIERVFIEDSMCRDFP